MTMNGPEAQQYWKEKLTLPNSEPAALDTQAMERALSESTPGRQRWVTKQITGHFAHGKNMLRRGQRSTAECPRCHAEIEDKQHIIRCPATSARTQWQSSIKKLSQWLKDQGTAIDIRIAIISHLERWAQGENSQEDTEQPFIGEQQHIGWDRMMDGWISRRWRAYQDKIWKNAKSRKSSLRWTAALIQKLWDVSWDMWEHRNQELHNSTENQQQIIHSRVNEQIKTLYAGGAQQLPRDALKFLQQPMDTILKYPLASKQIWLDAVQSAQTRRQRHEYGKYLGEQRFMATWLLSATTTSAQVEAQPD